MPHPVVALDAYPLLEPTTGVGRYVDHLIESLVALDDGPTIVLPTSSIRAGGAVRRPGTSTRHVRFPMRALYGLWERGDWPPGELLTGRVDLFHATNFVAPPMRRTPVVVTVHDLAHRRLPDTVDDHVGRLRTTLPALVAGAARVIAPTEAVAVEIRETFSLHAERVVAIPMGVSDPWFDPSSGAIPAEWHGAIVAVGMANRRKNLALLLEVKRRAGTTIPPVVVVGADAPGSDRPDGVVFAGRLVDDRLRALLGEASALAAPSALEGFGLPLLEAMAAGAPVVASDIPVHREVCGAHARYVEVPERPWSGQRAVVDAWIDALGAPPVSTPDGRRSHARSFTWERCAQTHAELYRAIADG